MRYSIEPKDRICAKEYGFLSFTKNMSNKYSQKILDTAKKSASKRAIQKNAEATSDLIGNTIADKITNASSTQRNIIRYYIQKKKRLIMKYQRKDIYLEKKDNKLVIN